MRDVLNDIMKWWDAGRLSAWPPWCRRSAAPLVSRARPWPPPADGEVIGSVSGGCVEGAVYELRREVVETGQPVLQTYGVSDDDAFAVGLTCGGILDIFVEPVSRERSPSSPTWPGRPADEPVAVATVVSGPGRDRARRDRVTPTAGASGSLGAGDRLDQAVDDDARACWLRARPASAATAPHGERRHDELAVFVNSFAPAAAHDGVRRDRLRRRGGAGRASSSATG